MGEGLEGFTGTEDLSLNRASGLCEEEQMEGKSNRHVQHGRTLRCGPKPFGSTGNGGLWSPREVWPFADTSLGNIIWLSVNTSYQLDIRDGRILSEE